MNEDILKFLEANANFDSLEYADKLKLDHQKVVGAIKSLQINEGLIEVQQKKSEDLSTELGSPGICKEW